MSTLGRCGAFALAMLAGGCLDSHHRFGQAETGEDATSTIGDESESESGVETDTEGQGDTEGDTDTDTEGDLPVDCSALDMVFVLHNGNENAMQIASVEAASMGIANFIKDPGQPWAGDFHVGVVRTHDTAGACNVFGAFSGDPRDEGMGCGAVAGNYASAEDGDQLGPILNCLAEVPIVMTDEPPPVALATARALGHEVDGDDEGPNVIDGCNGGFAREEALTVVMLVSGRDDEASPGDPDQWRQWFDEDEKRGLVVSAVLPKMECPETAARLLEWMGLHHEASVRDWCEFSVDVALLVELGIQIDQVCE